MEKITIPQYVYDELKQSQDTLDALYAAGVENWEGFEEAMKLYNSDPPKIKLENLRKIV